MSHLVALLFMVGGACVSWAQTMQLARRDAVQLNESFIGGPAATPVEAGVRRSHPPQLLLKGVHSYRGQAWIATEAL